jgi:hypothetical protein
MTINRCVNVKCGKLFVARRPEGADPAVRLADEYLAPTGKSPYSGFSGRGVLDSPSPSETIVEGLQGRGGEYVFVRTFI